MNLIVNNSLTQIFDLWKKIIATIETVLKIINCIFEITHLYTGLAKKYCTLRQSAITFLHRDNNLKFLPFFYNDILRNCLKFYNEIPRSNKMTAI